MRDINTNLYNKLISKSVDLYYAVELFFDGGTVRFWTGVGNKVINGNTYTGTGSLLNISGLEENDNLSSPGVNITLSGLDSAIVSLALQEPYQNRECKIHIGSDGDTLEVFSGFMDVMSIDDSGDSCSIGLSVESRLIILDRKSAFRYTQETQETRYPGDTFFSYVADLADKQVVWGRSASKPESVFLSVFKNYASR